jgi:hypothetical protein
MQEPNIYEIRTVADFHQIPLDKIAHCLEDFRFWLETCNALVAANIPGLSFAIDGPFKWIDDDRHDMHASIRLDTRKPANVG